MLNNAIEIRPCGAVGAAISGIDLSEPLSASAIGTVKETLADPKNLKSRQAAGTVHVHPNGRFLYGANRSDATVEFAGKQRRENSAQMQDSRHLAPTVPENWDTHVVAGCKLVTDFVDLSIEADGLYA